VTGDGRFTISPSSVASGGASHQIKAWAAGALEMHPKGIVQTTNEKRSARLGPSEDYAQGQADFEMANLRPERTGLPLIVFISQKGRAGAMFG
jgi:hypothetical protein